MTKRTITMGDFLLPAEIELVIEMFKEHKPGFAQRVCDLIIAPNMVRIDRALGQTNDAKYLGYACEFICMNAEAKGWLDMVVEESKRGKPANEN